MKKLFITFSILLLLFSCKEDDSPNVLQGHVYGNCSNEILDPMTLKVVGVQSVASGGYEYHDVGYITIDNNGFYYLEYKTKKNFEIIQFESSGNSILQMPYEKNINAVHYLHPTIEYTFILKVDDPKTSNDTLYLGGGFVDNNILSESGPFYDGQNINVVTPPKFEQSLDNRFYNAATDYGKVNFLWKIGKSNYDSALANSSEQVLPYYIAGVPQVLCERKIIILDLRGE